MTKYGLVMESEFRGWYQLIEQRMTWIEEADLPDLPAIFRVLSSNRQAVEVVGQLNEDIAFGNSTLGRVQEEAIATVVSAANRCRYGALTHGAFLRRYSGDSVLASQLLDGYTQADCSPKDRRMLDFAVRVTLEPASMSEKDIDGLRDAGFEDQGIVSIVLVTCLFNSMNRVASSLGVEVAPSFRRAVKGWLTGPAAQEGWLLGLGEEPAQPLEEPHPGMPEEDVTPPQARAGEGWLRGLGEEAAQPLEEPHPAMPEEDVVSPAVRAVEALLRGLGEEPAQPLEEPHRGMPEENVALPAVRAVEALLRGLGEEPAQPLEEPHQVMPEENVTPLEAGAGQAPDAGPEAETGKSLQRFVEDCCQLSPGGASTARDLYIAYVRWCDENRWGPLHQRSFGLGLADLGFRRQRRSHGRHWWLGIILKTGATDEMGGTDETSS